MSANGGFLLNVEQPALEQRGGRSVSLTDNVLYQAGDARQKGVKLTDNVLYQASGDQDHTDAIASALGAGPVYAATNIMKPASPAVYATAEAAAGSTDAAPRAISFMKGQTPAATSEGRLEGSWVVF